MSQDDRGSFLGDMDRLTPRGEQELSQVEHEQYLTLREEFASYAKKLVSRWLCFIAFVFVASGFSNLFGRQFLSDSVLIALVATTSLGVLLGLVSIILRHLFK